VSKEINEETSLSFEFFQGLGRHPRLRMSGLVVRGLLSRMMLGVLRWVEHGQKQIITTISAKTQCLLHSGLF